MCWEGHWTPHSTIAVSANDGHITGVPRSLPCVKRPRKVFVRYAKVTFLLDEAIISGLYILLNLMK